MNYVFIVAAGGCGWQPRGAAAGGGRRAASSSRRRIGTSPTGNRQLQIAQLNGICSERTGTIGRGQ